jgi:hypothetical protein
LQVQQIRRFLANRSDKNPALRVDGERIADAENPDGLLSRHIIMRCRYYMS